MDSYHVADDGAGGVTVLLWKQLKGEIFDLYEIIPGFLISSLVIIIFSIIDKKPDEKVGALFDAA